MQNKLLSLALCCLPLVARADEPLFAYLYTTETLPKAAWEYEQWQTARSGRVNGKYLSIDLRNEIEYGITDRLIGALYLNSSYINIDGVTGMSSRSGFDINGMSAEFRYRLLSPETDGFGLAFYIEPEVTIRSKKSGKPESEKGLDLKLIFQKNFCENRLIMASNIMFEPEWKNGWLARELKFEFTFGTTYRFGDTTWGGFEFRNSREFGGIEIADQEYSAYFLGPNVHYGTTDWWATVAVLPQIQGNPPSTGTERHLANHEKLEVRVKFGIPL